LARFFAGYGVRLTVLNAAEDHTPEQELTDDLLAILSWFAGRLYGMRSGTRQARLACAKQVLAGEE
jgi:predicted site-specific integrase-resolvase